MSSASSSFSLRWRGHDVALHFAVEAQNPVALQGQSGGNLGPEIESGAVRISGGSFGVLDGLLALLVAV
jgi:hypothetical protein